MAEPRFTINIHVREDVPMKADRVPSSAKDFVSIDIGSQASVFLFDSAQAKALAMVAADAYHLLKLIELEKEREEMDMAWNDARSLEPDPQQNDYEYDSFEDPPCTIEKPCPACQQYDEDPRPYDEYEPF